VSVWTIYYGSKSKNTPEILRNTPYSLLPEYTPGVGSREYSGVWTFAHSMV